MAYTLTYKVHFTNEQNQEIIADIFRKDGDAPTTVAEYECIDFEISDKSEGQTKYESTIIARELILTMWSKISDEITWETFITAEHDEWKIVVTIDGDPYFHGFITPDEGNALFQDKPYEITIRATNGLALLKDVDLVDVTGAAFDSDHKLIDYIAGALKQTGLDLPIRTQCGYFNKQIFNKYDSLNFDMFGQVSLNYRTFQDSPTSFVSCYDTLMYILDKFCRLEYWNGYWYICSVAELQYYPSVKYYVDYSTEGVATGGAADPDNYHQIGKAVDLYPINEDQQIFSRYAIKSAKTIFNYNIWPEIPKNNKFERGSKIAGATGIVYQTDENGNDTSTQIGTYQDYTINDWEQVTFNTQPPGPPVDDMWRRSSYNQYGVEINREIVISKSTNDTQGLRSEGLPVYVGDRVSLSLDFRLSYNFGAQLQIAVATVYIIPNAGGRFYYWRDGASVSNRWTRPSVALDSIFLSYPDGTDHTKVYKSFSLESQPIPADGTLYIVLHNVLDSGLPNAAYFRNFNFEYRPFVAGGYVQVKGDYWIRSQTKVYPDVAKEEVTISDSPKKMIKGSLLVGSALAEPTWYRFGIPETRKFKELLNIARYNHSYRRMYAIDGSFNGLNSAPENNQLAKVPISFHYRYRFVDMTGPRDFVLVPPLKMDLIKGWVNASCVEVINPNDTTTITPNVDFVIQRLADLINFTTAAEWNSNGGAPLPGTVGFPPFAAPWTYSPRSLGILLDASNSVGALALPNGAVNIPSMSVTGEIVTDKKLVIIEVGASVALNNIFRINIYGHTITYTVAQEIRQNDGTQPGDSSSFNYIFDSNG